MLIPTATSLSTTAIASWAVIITACCFATVVDVRERRIPNKLTLPLWLSGFAWWLAVAGPAGLGEALGGMAVAGLPFFVLWMIGGGGAGDAKMMFAIGAWLGIEHGYVAALGVGLAGGILSLGYAIVHGRLFPSLVNTAWMTLTLPFVLLGPGRFSERRKLVPPSADGPLKTPYSVAMLAGTCGALVWVWTCSA